MKKISLSILLFFVLTFQTFAAVELDTDGNQAIDINRGGTNAKTAGAALSNLGGQPYDADLDILSSGTFSQKRALIEAFAKPVFGVDALRTTMADFDGDCRYLVYHTASGDGGHGTFRWDASSTATDDNGVTIAITGVAVGRWIRQFSGYVKVEMFGCFVGAADNSPAFQKILDSGITEIQFGVGQYDFGSGFVLSTPITVIGAGSKALDYPTYGTILRHTGDDDFFFFNLPSTTRGGSFRDLKIQSTSKTNSVFRFNNCWRFRLEHLDINGGGYSIYAEGLTFAIIAESCKIQLYEIAGYFGDGTTTDAKILNCDIAPTVDSTAWGIINKGNGTLVSGCWFECGPGDRAVGAGGHIYQPADSPNIASIKIVNNNLGRTGVNGGNHIRIEGGLTAAISGNSFAGGSTPDAPLIYIDTLTGSEGLYHCKIQGNKFTNIIQEAIYVNNGYVTINGNSFHVNTNIFTAANIIKDIYSATSSLIVSDNYFTSSTSISKCAIAGSVTLPVVKECNNNVVFNMGLSSGYVETAIGNRIHGGTAKTAQGLSVRSGNVIGNFFKNLAVGLVARACVVNSNTFETCTTTITPYTADGVNPKIEGNQGDTQELTTSGTPPTRWGITTVNTSSGAFSGTLGSGYRIGDFKAFVVTSHSGNYTLTVSSLEGASKTCTFTSASSTLLLMWDGTTWVNLKAIDITIS